MDNKSKNENFDENEVQKKPIRSNKKILTTPANMKSTEKSSQKENKKNPVMTKILDSYKTSIFFYFLKASTIKKTKNLKYLSPFESKPKLPCLVSILDFGIIIYLNPKCFRQNSSWYNKEPQIQVKKLSK